MEIYYLPYDNGNGTVEYFEPWGETMP
ncbi:hypothetical protein PBAL39_00050 [Pedobacter sp. BAL39]|nr:hypothetical protein PBAL39_00050 [Pedobacter sp. BAL39]